MALARLAHTAPGEPRFAVLVATRNRGTKIVPLLDSILACDTRDFELVIVDQSTSDETRRAIEPYLSDARVRYVHSDVPGASRARNRGIALTRAPIIVITDDDCLVPRDWLARISAPFELQSDVGVVFCNVDAVPVTEPGYTPHIHFARSRTVSDVRKAWSARQLSLGAGMAIRRAILEDVRGFDESLGPGSVFPAAEDNDLAWRALISGWRVYENADVTVLHDGFRSMDQLRDLVKRDFYGIGGTIAKYLKSGHWEATTLLANWIVRYGVTEPAIDMLKLRRPRGFRRPYMLLRGLVDGLRRPVDKTAICYVDRPTPTAS